MNLSNLAKKYNSRQHPEVTHYFDIYHHYFNKYRDKNINLLEIGVLEGAGIRMWLEYFPKAKIFGMDKKAIKFVDDRVTLFQGDQSDTDFLDKIISQMNNLDIVIDDGGHKMHQQITSFKKIFPILNSGGIYLIEDLCTSYWPSHNKTYSVTTIEYLKSLVDSVTHLKNKNKGKYTDYLAIHFHDSMCFIEKR